MFNVKKKMKADLDAAITLGISDQAYNRNVDISGAEKGAIEQGIFRPYVPSRNVLQAFQQNADALGVNNPYIDAASTINDIRAELSGLSLDDAQFPNIENPLVPMDIGTTLPSVGANTLNLPNVNANMVTNQGGNIPYNQMTEVQKRAYYDSMFGRS